MLFCPKIINFVYVSQSIYKPNRFVFKIGLGSINCCFVSQVQNCTQAFKPRPGPDPALDQLVREDQELPGRFSECTVGQSLGQIITNLVNHD